MYSLQCRGNHCLQLSRYGGKGWSERVVVKKLDGTSFSAQDAFGVFSTHTGVEMTRGDTGLSVQIQAGKGKGGILLFGVTGLRKETGHAFIGKCGSFPPFPSGGWAGDGVASCCALTRNARAHRDAFRVTWYQPGLLAHPRKSMCQI